MLIKSKNKTTVLINVQHKKKLCSVYYDIKLLCLVTFFTIKNINIYKIQI